MISHDAGGMGAGPLGFFHHKTDHYWKQVGLFQKNSQTSSNGQRIVGLQKI
jgi:hypothetical protein